jgi:hypothetical protein
MGCVINWKLMGADGQKVDSVQKRIAHWELFSFGFVSHFIHCPLAGLMNAGSIFFFLNVQT